jgi:hypothetical protein
MTGWVDGAVRSGERAAAEVMQHDSIVGGASTTIDGA